MFAAITLPCINSYTGVCVSMQNVHWPAAQFQVGDSGPEPAWLLVFPFEQICLFSDLSWTVLVCF